MQDPPDKISKYFYIVIASQIALVGLALILIKVLNVRLPVEGFFKLSTISIAVVAAFLTYALLAKLTTSNTRLGKALHYLSEQTYPMFQDLNWFQITAVAILAGVSEELLFRVFLQSWIIELSNAWMGILIAALIFGLLHYMNFIYFMFTFFLGLLLGIVYYLSNSASLVIYWHAAYDLIAIAVLAKFPHLLNIKNAIAER